MKKYIDTAFYYAIAAMAGGVFFREFTKFSGFTAKTTLSVVHTHFFLLGMLFMLVIALLAGRLEVEGRKNWNRFFFLYNIGVPVTGVMLLVRGVLQVLGTELSAGLNASISGIAGLGHIIMGVGLVYCFLALKEAAKNEPPYSRKQ